MAYSFPMIRGESDRFLEQSLLRRDPPVGYALEAEACPAWRAMYCSALWRIQGRMSWLVPPPGPVGQGVRR